MFTEDEIKTAKATRAEIISQDIDTLKGIYMAGEICMWDEMQPKNLPKYPAQTPVIPSGSWKLKLNKWYYEHPVQAIPTIDDIISWVDEEMIQPLEKRIENLEILIKTWSK